jgi:hypothetical protein
MKLLSMDLVRGTSEKVRGTRERMRQKQAFVWWIPVFVAFAGVALTEKRLLDVMGACLALLLLVFMVNRPGGTLIALVIFLPLEIFLFSLLFRFGMPGSFLRPASALKELMAIAILIAGLRAIRDRGHKLDRIDIVVLIYVGVVTLYLIVPHLFAETAVTQWSPRFLAWRSDAAYPLIFFGARHAPISPRMKQRMLQVVVVLGAVMAFIALYQKLAPSSFSNFVLNTVHVVQYQENVLGQSPSTVASNLAYITTIDPLRVSSILLSPFDLGDYLVIVVAAVGVRIGQNARNPLNYVVLAAAMGAIWFTSVRADALAGVIILALTALPHSRSPVEGRIRLIAALLVAAAFIVPSLPGSRFVGAQGGSSSASGHITEIEDGLNVFYYYPLGLGLGAQPGIANRFNPSKSLNSSDVSDNFITQTADELGVQALIPWLIMFAFILIALKRRAGPGDPFAATFGFALLATMIAGIYHHVFLTFPGPWTLWAGTGLALSVYKPDTYEDSAESTITYPASAGVR